MKCRDWAFDYSLINSQVVSFSLSFSLSTVRSRSLVVSFYVALFFAFFLDGSLPVWLVLPVQFSCCHFSPFSLSLAFSFLFLRLSRFLFFLSLSLTLFLPFSHLSKPTLYYRSTGIVLNFPSLSPCVSLMSPSPCPSSSPTSPSSSSFTPLFSSFSSSLSFLPFLSFFLFFSSVHSSALRHGHMAFWSQE